MSIATADSEQLDLLEIMPSVPILKTAQARNIYGSIAENVVCKSLNLFPIRINGKHEVCPDAMIGKSRFEIKSVHRNGKVVVYDWRLKRDQEKCPDLIYLIYVHRIKSAKTVEDIYDNLSALPTKQSLIVLSSSTIRVLAGLEKLNVPVIKNPGKRVGYERKGYCDGYYNLSVKRMMQTTSVVGQVKATIFNREIVSDLRIIV